MTVEMMVGLSPEKACDCILKYFEARDDIEVKSSEPNSIQIHTSGSRHPWIDIKIRLFGEENRTRLAFNFSYLKVYAIIAMVTLGVLAVVWIFAVNTIEAIVISTIIGIGASISLGSELSKFKRKFLDDIHKSFELLNKTN